MNARESNYTDSLYNAQDLHGQYWCLCANGNLRINRKPCRDIWSMLYTHHYKHIHARIVHTDTYCSMNIVYISLKSILKLHYHSWILLLLCLAKNSNFLTWPWRQLLITFELLKENGREQLGVHCHFSQWFYIASAQSNFRQKVLPQWRGIDTLRNEAQQTGVWNLACHR